jgi:methylated-DNA-protein-cysteine methyltransferase-like protein
MAHKGNPGLFEKVYLLVRKIPKGKVMTYGQIAEMLKTRDARKIGWALHGNKDPKTPCHRVVSKEGKVATNYAFEGWEEQKRKLLLEGVTFIDEKRVDLEKHLWSPINSKI